MSIKKTILIISILLSLFLLIFISIQINVDKNILLIILSCIALFGLFFGARKQEMPKNNQQIHKIQLLSDDPVKTIKEKIKPLIRIIEAHSNHSSFSMALIGKWGSGKSSYLKTLEEELKDDYEIIYLNSWQLENSENITNELKKELLPLPHLPISAIEKDEVWE